MAHFAEINSEGIVQRVIVVDNNDCKDAEGNESEAVGAAFCNNLLGGVWKQTSYNGNIRKNYAGIGYQYDEDLDAFIPPQPFSKWILNEETAQWEAPVPMPEGNEEDRYVWNDNKGEWEQVVVE
jgi:hypothetical protein